MTNSDGDVYIEVYDNANSATNSTTQTLNVSFTALSGVGTGALTKYTSFTDGSTLASGFAVAHTITTVSGNHYSGNATTATRLQNAVNITINNSTKSFNGASAISWSANDIGLNNYVAKAGDTMTGILRMENANYGPIVIRRTSGTTHFAGIKFENTAG